MTPQEQYEFGVFLSKYAPELAALVVAPFVPFIFKAVSRFVDKRFPVKND